MKIADILFLLIISSFTNAAVSEDLFQTQVQPLLKTYCYRCHNSEVMEFGIRLDQLDGQFEDRRLRLWEGVQRQIADQSMPPEDELRPTSKERKILLDWIKDSLHVARSRPVEMHGSVRRLTVSQYRSTLRDLLGLQEDLTQVLPPDAISKDGFSNSARSMLLSPLQVEAYFNIAEKALDLSIVNENEKPSIQNFRVDLGKNVNHTPYPDQLILGANSHLVANQDFRVVQLKAQKSFVFSPFYMRTKYRFHEGYQGNSTVRGWKSYDSISHAVFACMRGSGGKYPKGEGYETIPEGMLLRPAIPSRELFGVESTYGPKANFKIALRELPDYGEFRVTVNAAKYDDGLLLNEGVAPCNEPDASAINIRNPDLEIVNVKQAGIYQVDVHLKRHESQVSLDDSHLDKGLVGVWHFDGEANGKSAGKELDSRLTEGAKYVDSPFGNALSVDGKAGAVVVARNDSMNVADGDFSVAAWIRPSELRQSGIFCLGKYSWTHGWYFDMPNDRGVLRLETANSDNQTNGTVASRPGVIRANVWQHVAAVVRRGSDETKLYVNGFQVAQGTIQPTNLDNSNVDLHIGRIQDSKLFHGELDEVRFYRRALDLAEIQALVEPGRQFAMAPPFENPKTLKVEIGDRHFSGTLYQPAFLAIRLPAGPVKFQTQYAGDTSLDRVVLTPLTGGEEIAQRFVNFEKRLPRLGVHVGLRRDCGHTLSPVGRPQTIAQFENQKFTFHGAINNFPSPDVQEDNDNYLAGIREIGIRSEYTDGRDMPRLLVQSVEFEGPYYDSWPPASHRNIFIDSEHKDDPPTYAREIISSFAQRSFRRPISSQEENSLVAVWEQSFSESGDFQQSIRDALVVVLTSPQFLFLIEESRSPELEPLGPYELASKLSYFLWNSNPDKELLRLAAHNVLHQQLDEQITRMIKDTRFNFCMSQFVSQWLSLDKLDVVEVDAKRYPMLTREAKAELRQESIFFVQHLIQNNLPVRNLVKSDFIVANEVVAQYYGLGHKAETGFDFFPIQHENSNLGGVLTNAGILAGLSDGRESNPVKRGAWLARKIIAEPPDDPPPNVPALDEDVTHLTLRERLERHRNQKGCVKCHEGIDPWGIPFEQFDAAGLLKRQKVDAHSTLPDNTDVANLEELKLYLAEDRLDQVAFSFMKHVASYAVGRSLSYNEIEFLRQNGVTSSNEKHRMQDMIRFVIKSDMFLKK